MITSMMSIGISYGTIVAQKTNTIATSVSNKEFTLNTTIY